MAITASKSIVIKGGIALLVVYTALSFLNSGKEGVENAVFQEPVVARADQGSFDISIIE